MSDSLRIYDADDLIERRPARRQALRQPSPPPSGSSVNGLRVVLMLLGFGICGVGAVLFPNLLVIGFGLVIVLLAAIAK